MPATRPISTTVVLYPQQTPEFEFPQVITDITERIDILEGDLFPIRVDELTAPEYTTEYDTLGAYLQSIGPSIPVTGIEVTRIAAAGNGEAIIETPIEESKPLAIVGDPEYQIGVKLFINDSHAFTGTIDKVTENEDGIVTIIAADLGKTLNRHTVRLDTREEGLPSTVLFWDLVVKDGPLDPEDVVVGFGGPPVSTDPDTTAFKEFYGLSFSEDEIEDRIDSAEPVPISISVGQNDRAQLLDVIKAIARKQQAFVYVDRRNRLHFTERPPIGPGRKAWPLDRIKSIDAGSSNNDNESVIVESPDINSIIGPGPSRTSEESSRAKAIQGNPDDSEVRRIQDNNVLSIKEANNQAVDEVVSSRLANSSGTVTLVGTPFITPFDRVYIGDLPDWISLGEGFYSVRKVTHTINNQDGYVTKLDLTEDLKDVYDSLLDTIGRTDDLASIVTKSEVTPDVFGLTPGDIPVTDPDNPVLNQIFENADDALDTLDPFS